MRVDVEVPRRGAPAGLLLACGIAAGAVRRPGSAPGPQVGAAARHLRNAGCSPVVVVLDASTSRACSDADLDRCEVLLPPDAGQGLGAGLRAGVAHLGDTSCQVCVLAMADEPLVPTAAVQRLVHSWDAAHADAVVGTVGGRPCGPVVLDRSVWWEVGVTARRGTGAQNWLDKGGGRVREVACDDVAGYPG